MHQRGIDGDCIYTQITKRKLTERKRVKVERRLSKDEYLRLLMDTDPTCRPIRKTRYCLTWDNQYFEIDIYPFWHDRAILEIELSSETAPFHFPEHIRALQEVTEDPAYKTRHWQESEKMGEGASRMTAKKVCITSMGVALFVVLSLCLQVPVFENYYLCLGYGAMMVFCFYFGPISGMIVGSLGVVLYFLLTNGLRGMPGWAIGTL